MDRTRFKRSVYIMQRRQLEVPFPEGDGRAGAERFLRAPLRLHDGAAGVCP